MAAFPDSSFTHILQPYDLTCTYRMGVYKKATLIDVLWDIRRDESSQHRSRKKLSRKPWLFFTVGDPNMALRIYAIVKDSTWNFNILRESLHQKFDAAYIVSNSCAVGKHDSSLVLCRGRCKYMNSSKNEISKKKNPPPPKNCFVPVTCFAFGDSSAEWKLVTYNESL